jgi:cellobiose-specific phosphotransferase system component IIA
MIAPDPLKALVHLENWILLCGQCREDVTWAIESIRAGLRAPLDDAADALERAQARLQHEHGPHAEAIQYALVQAAVNLGHARQLAGKG